LIQFFLILRFCNGHEVHTVQTLITWQFWPISGATMVCSIRWKALSFKQHYRRFAGTRRYAYSHSSPHACAAVACFRSAMSKGVRKGGWG